MSDLGALRRHARGRRRHAARAPLAGITAIGAGKGGVGTSVFSGLLATAIARAGVRTLLVDLDPGHASQHLLFGVRDPGPGLDALRDGATDPESLVEPVAPFLDLMHTASPDPVRSGRTSLAARLRNVFESYPVVLFDVGARAETALQACELGAARLFCVTDGDRLSMAATYGLLKLHAERFPEVPRSIVCSRTLESDGRHLHSTMREATHRFLGADVPYEGSIPNDDIVTRLVERGAPFSELPDASPAMLAADSIGRGLCAALFGSSTPALRFEAS